MKQDTLILTAAVIGGLYLMSRQKGEEASSSGMPSINLTMPSTGLPSFKITNPGGGGFSGTIPSDSSLGANAALLAIIDGLRQQVTDLAKQTAGLTKQATGSSGGGNIPHAPTPEEVAEAIRNFFKAGGSDNTNVTPSATGEEVATSWNPFPDADTEAIRNKAGIGVGLAAGGAEAYLTRKVPSLLARSIFKAAPTGLKLAGRAIPFLGWAWTAAEVAATAYELISGKSVFGDWLGWGEMIRGEGPHSKDYLSERDDPPVQPSEILAISDVTSGYSTESPGSFTAHFTETRPGDIRPDVFDHMPAPGLPWWNDPEVTMTPEEEAEMI